MPRRRLRLNGGRPKKPALAAEAERQRQAAAETARREAEDQARQIAERETLTRNLQTALKRVGCFAADVDGKLDEKSQTALGAFVQRTKLDLATDRPTDQALSVVNARTTRICPLQCKDGEIESGGRCVLREVDRAQPSTSRRVTKSENVPHPHDTQGKRTQQNNPTETGRRPDAQSSGNCWAWSDWARKMDCR